MNIDGIGFQGVHGNSGVNGKGGSNKTGETPSAGEATSTSGAAAPQDNNIDKVQEFYLKFKAGVLSFEELCSRLQSLGVELQFQKDNEGNNIVGVTFRTNDGNVYCSADGNCSAASATESANVTTADENGLTVTTKKHSDGSSTITRKDENGNLVEVEEQNAQGQTTRLTRYNEAGKVQDITEFEYNQDGSYMETVKNASGQVVSKTEVSADGKTRNDVTPNYAGSILNGQLFSMDDIIDAGFNSVDIAKYFTIIKGNDGNFYYELKTSAGDAESLEDFHNDIMQSKADEVIAKYESGSITFVEIIQELKLLGFTNIHGENSADGSNVIYYQCGNNTYTVEDTTMRDINKEWASCVSNGDNVEAFAKTLESFRGVTDVEYSKTDYGTEKIAFKLDGILHTFTSIPTNPELPEEESEE